MKRFTATEKWDKQWFQALPPKLKCLWYFLFERCDCAGVWEPNFGLASFMIGETILESDLSYFGDRIERLKSGKFWIVSFTEFQYGSISKDCKAHIPVIRALEKHGLNQRVSKGYPKGIHTLKEKEKEKEEGECEGKRVPTPEEIYEAYPLKVGKPKAIKSIEVRVKEFDPAWLLERTRLYAKIRGDSPYTPHPTTWFNQARFNDDPKTWEPKEDGNRQPAGHPTTASFFDQI